MTATTTGTPWTVVSVAHFKNGRRRGDGDTFDAIRTRVAQLGDDWFQLTDLEAKPLRLAWVDTPESNEAGWAQASADFTRWILDAEGPLTVVCFGSAGWDRILCDLRDSTESSASQWLMAECGWPPYTGAKA